MSEYPNPLTLCIVAGKSGGHIIPCLTLAKAWKEKNPLGIVISISTNTTLDRTLTTTATINHRYYLSLDNVPRHVLKMPIFGLQLLCCFWTNYRILRKQRPIKVISTGGYIAIPTVLAAYVLRIPVELWELNATPGRALRFLSPYATRIYTCFIEAQKYLPQKKCAVAAYPIRYRQEEKITPERARNILGFDQQRVTLFILGGSQGSTSLSALMSALINQFPELAHKIQCIHQTGASDNTFWKTLYGQHNIPAYVFGYCHDLAPLLCAADIVISRAGAGAIFEIDFFEKTCVLVPLQTDLTSHQQDNALAYAHRQPDRAYCCMTEQEALKKIHELVVTHKS